MIDITIKDDRTGSWLAHLMSPVIPRVGEMIKLTGFDENRPVVNIEYVYGQGEDQRGLSYVNVMVGPKQR